MNQSKTRFVVFSKNRTLQLKSLLISLFEQTDIPPGSVTILYVATGEISYDHLIDKFPDCQFVRQNIFLDDIREIVAGSNSEYVGWMVDDLICRDGFSLSFIEKYLDENSDVDAFSLRLGKNIQPRELPVFILEDNETMVWDTSPRYGKHWNYFWDLSSSIYRRALVDEFLSKCDSATETFPNPFETRFFSLMPATLHTGLAGLVNRLRFPFRRRYGRMACFQRSKVLTQGVNLVADIVGDDRAQQFSPEELHAKMLEGMVVDFRGLRGVDNEFPNVGHQYFKLIPA